MKKKKLPTTIIQNIYILYNIMKLGTTWKGDK